jgi:DNA topoisomerase I
VADANKLIKAFAENSDIQILNGRFGPYIKAGKKNVKIPKGREPVSLTLEECVALADAAPEKKGRWGRAYKTAAAPATTAVKTPARKTARKIAPEGAAVKTIVAKKVSAKKASKKTAKKAAKKVAKKRKK